MAALIERDGARCRECGTEESLTVDHVHPKSRGGSEMLDNLQILCWGCNARKADAIPTEAA